MQSKILGAGENLGKNLREFAFTGIETYTIKLKYFEFTLGIHKRNGFGLFGI